MNRVLFYGGKTLAAVGEEKDNVETVVGRDNFIGKVSSMLVKEVISFTECWARC